jgi:hypothetical protein
MQQESEDRPDEGSRPEIASSPDSASTDQEAAGYESPNVNQGDEGYKPVSRGMTLWLLEGRRKLTERIGTR